MLLFELGTAKRSIDHLLSTDDKMTELDDAYVKRGLWTDWSRGPVLGRTITTDSTTGAIIVSMLAIMSSLAATHLWHIVAFSVHQYRAKGKPSNGLFWQQQVLWRTM